jgi:hypothetical protein
MTSDDWRPIETAPKDGTVFLAWVNAFPVGLAFMAFWDRGIDEPGYVDYCQDDWCDPQPTHWQPIVPPKQEPPR